MNRRLARRLRAAALCAGALAAILPAGAVHAEPVTLTIVHVNDLDRLDGSGDRGGVARLAAVVNDVRASADHVLVPHGGGARSRFPQARSAGIAIQGPREVHLRGLRMSGHSSVGGLTQYVLPP